MPKSSLHGVPSGTTAKHKSRARCAIYTRKSSEEGLEQDFNSLDAQREACEAFILSQKHEGWVCLPEMYDDGGISGATMERPALKRLLSDIEARRIDTVVVYKVDRLTRSLGDFAKIVDVFDGHGVSFVSVTQQFNTTTIGDLTKAMSWQPHSVRGAISGTLKKKLGLAVTSENVEGRGRVYRIASAGE